MSGRRSTLTRLSWNYSWSIALTICIVSALLFLFSGYNARQWVLNSNSCKMTYSSKDKMNVELYSHCGKRCPYKLYKISNARKRSVLNKQPVMFIPGHLGSADQARSLASPMHDDDDHFQHFALDFGADYLWDSSAFHGSGVLAQAAAVNQALRRIIRMYEMAGKPLFVGDESNHTQIILVGHSIGGFIARVALLMNNHPSSPCPVGDIVQLSSPNDRPPFSPDPSLEMIYYTAAQAYRTSYTERVTTACKDYRSQMLHPKMLINITRVDYDYLCPSSCVAKTRILSIAGGEVDMQVAPRLTLLKNVHPVRRSRSTPANTSVSGNATMSTSSIRSTLGQVLYFLINPIDSMKSFIWPKSNSTSNSGSSSNEHNLSSGVENANNGTLPSDDDGSRVSVAVMESGVVEAINATDSNQSNSSLSANANVESVEILEGNNSMFEASPNASASISTNQTETKAEAAEAAATESMSSRRRGNAAPLINIRMSQLTDVGFPTDHLAMVWCYQLMQSITSTLRKIHALKPEERSDRWFDFLPLHENFSRALREDIEIGSPMANQTSAFDKAKAMDDSFVFDKMYQHPLVSGSYALALLFFSAFRYFSGHWVKIVISYLVVSLTVLTVPLLRLLSGYNDDSKALHEVTSFSFMQPWSLLSLDLTFPAVIYSVHRMSLSPGIDQAPSLVWQLCGLALLAKLLYDWYTQGSYYDVLLSYEDTIYWVVSLLVVLPVRLIVLLMVKTVQSISEYILSRLYKLFRLTLWNKNARATARGVWKSCKKACLTYIPFANVVAKTMRGSVFPLVLAALWLSIYLSTSARRKELFILGGSHLYNLSICGTIFFIIMLAGLFFGIAYCPLSNSDSRNRDRRYFTEVCMLYLPAAIIGFPSFWFGYRILFSSDQFDVVLAPVLGAMRLFSVEMIIFSACTAAISIHLWSMRYNMALLSDVPVWQVARDFMGPPILEAVNDLYPATIEQVTPFVYPYRGMDNRRTGACVHEDGGRFAVYECILGDDVPNVEEKAHPIQDGVWIGSTYRVVSCNCARDFSLKERSEWCGWCLCRKCGGKNLQPLYESSQYGSSVPFCSDVFLLLSLFGGAWYSMHFVEDRPHRILHICAAIAAMFFVSHLLRGSLRR